MKRRLVAGLLAAISLMAAPAGPGHAADCPVESLSPLEVGKLIREAATCERALTIFQSCGMGATSDTVLSGLVTEKCEAVFDGKLSAGQRRAYARAERACGRKYAKETGSEYRSLESFCYAEAAARMAKAFAKAKSATPSRK